MIPRIIEEMKPVLKDETLALTLLGEYWQDKIAVVWDAQDVLDLAKEQRYACDLGLARKILKDILECHDEDFGITWYVLAHHIREKCVPMAQDGWITVWDEEELGACSKGCQKQ